MRGNRFIAILLGIMLLSSGCMVISVYPFYSGDLVRFDQSLVGRWDAGAGEYWEFSKKQDDDRYLITIIDDEVIVGIMEGTLFDAGGYTFMDMYPWDFEYKQVVQGFEYLVESLGDSVSSSVDFDADYDVGTEMDLWWNNMHLMPTHSVLRVVKKDADTLQLAMLDVEWLTDQLKENPGLISYELPGQESSDIMGEDDPILLTASTKELQRFIARYAGNGDAFELESLTRVKP